MAKYKIFTTLSHIIAHHKTYLHIPKTQENSAAFYNFSSRATRKKFNTLLNYLYPQPLDGEDGCFQEMRKRIFATLSRALELCFDEI